MTKPKSLSLYQRMALFFETNLMTMLVPKHTVGTLFGFLFKTPLFFHRIGLNILIPRGILILTTVGRRTGIPRQTPVEFRYDDDKEAYVVMSGWEGRTDWYRNARANPKVSIWVAGERIHATAVPAPDHEVAAILKEITKRNPKAKRIWSRWSEVEINGTTTASTPPLLTFQCSI